MSPHPPRRRFLDEDKPSVELPTMRDITSCNITYNVTHNHYHNAPANDAGTGTVQKRSAIISLIAAAIGLLRALWPFP